MIHIILALALLILIGIAAVGFMTQTGRIESPAIGLGAGMLFAVSLIVLGFLAIEDSRAIASERSISGR